MPRQGRQLSEGKIYYVMNRGNARKNIFHRPLTHSNSNKYIFYRLDGSQDNACMINRIESENPCR
jgi:hypothetical protein